MIAPVTTYGMRGLQPKWPGGRTLAAKFQANLTNLPKGAVLEEATSSQDNIWSIAGSPAGTWTLTFRGHTTAALSATITGAALMTALNALPSINGGISAQSGGPIGTGAILLTFGGGSFDNSPVELPTTSVAMTLSQNQVGRSAGSLGPSATNSTAARFLNQYDLSTDGAGNISFADAADAAEWGIEKLTAPVWWDGVFELADLPQAAITGITGGYVTATTLAALGKMLYGSLTTGKGALRIGV